MSEWKELLVLSVVLFLATNGAVCLFEGIADWVIRIIEKGIRGDTEGGRRMTNYEAITRLEVSGAQIFAHKTKSAILEILREMECEDCPVLDECEDVRLCDSLLVGWLNQEAGE